MKTSNQRNKNGAGKGDRYRPVNRKKWDKAYDKIKKGK